MISFLKKFILTLFFIIIFCIIALIIAIYWVNPNHYRKEISAHLSKITHTKVNINGEIKWQIWPTPHFNISNITLEESFPQNGNSKNVNYAFFESDHSEIEISLRSLLFGKVKLKKLEFNHASLNYYTSKNQIFQLHNIHLKAKQINQFINIQTLTASIQQKIGSNILSGHFDLNTDIKINDSGKFINLTNLNFQSHCRFKKNIFVVNYTTKNLRLPQKKYHLHPITGSLDNAPYDAELNIDTSKSTHSILFLLNLKSLNLEHWITFPTNIGSQWQNIHLRADLYNPPKTHNIMGNILIKATDGTLNGYDFTANKSLFQTFINNISKNLSNALNEGLQLSKSLQNPTPQTLTKFKHLYVSINLNTPKTMTLQKFKVRGTGFYISGTGIYNIQEDTLNTQLNLFLQTKPDFTIPIQITGSLEHPEYNFQSSALEKQIQTLINQALNLYIQQKFHARAQKNN